MARIADVDLTQVPKHGRRPKYPWAEWFDGRTHILEQGVDYDAESPKAFRSTIYSAASRLKVTVETRIMPVEGDDDLTPHLHVQAILPKLNGSRKRIRRTDGA
jgi:hypothetical protein